MQREPIVFAVRSAIDFTINLANPEIFRDDPAPFVRLFLHRRASPFTVGDLPIASHQPNCLYNEIGRKVDYTVTD